MKFLKFTVCNSESVQLIFMNVKEGVHRCKVPGLYLFYMYVPVIYLNSFVHYFGVCVVTYEYR